MHAENYWWYLELSKYGTVPHAGFGAGFESLVQFVTGMENIRDVIPFPRAPGTIDFLTNCFIKVVFSGILTTMDQSTRNHSLSVLISAEQLNF